MVSALRAFSKTLPSLITALLLAVAVWILAVTSSDPSIEKIYPNTVSVEVIGQASNLVITTELSETVSLTLRAPTSIWNSMVTEKAPVRAVIDLSGLGEGTHTIPIQIQIGIKPVEIRSFTPRSIFLELEPLASQSFDITIINQGVLAVGYQSETPKLSETSAIVTGAKSLVDRVDQVRAVVRLTDVKASISESISLQPVDKNGIVVKRVSVTPEKITLTQVVSERGGYRNMVVKVVTVGQIADGYHLTYLSVSPLTVTVFSTDPVLVDALPGYIETKPFDLTGRKDNFEDSVELLLPAGIQAIDSQSVLVNVGISAIQSSLALNDVKVEVFGLHANLKAIILPDKVNIIVSGPLNALETINLTDLRVILDLTGFLAGKYTLEPDASLNIPNIKIESLSPTTFVITIR
jgi:YbbR domain-containing protein